MKINLNAEIPLRSEPVTLGDEGEFHIHVKSPTYADLIRDLTMFESFMEPRMRATIVGWTGLMQDTQQLDGTTVEEEIPFTWENLQRLCEKYPATLQQMARIASKTFKGVAGETATKNGRPASALFSADAVIRQMGLSSGVNSAGSVGLQNPPA